MSDPTRRQLAAGIRALRESQNWTQEELALRLKVTAATVSRWESGKHLPEPEHLGKLAEINRKRGNSSAKFLERFLSLRAREQWETTLERAAGVVESAHVGPYLIELMEDGSLRISNTER